MLWCSAKVYGMWKVKIQDLSLHYDFFFYNSFHLVCKNHFCWVSYDLAKLLQKGSAWKYYHSVAAASLKKTGIRDIIPKIYAKSKFECKIKIQSICFGWFVFEGYINLHGQVFWSIFSLTALTKQIWALFKGINLLHVQFTIQCDLIKNMSRGHWLFETMIFSIPLLPPPPPTGPHQIISCGLRNRVLVWNPSCFDWLGSVFDGLLKLKQI